MKKGFTLIELLAVIVILAIIALIATPIVLGIIEDTKESATLRSAEMYLSSVENSIMRENMKKGGNFSPKICLISNGNLSCDDSNEIVKVEVDGEKPIKGVIKFINGKITSSELVYQNTTLVKNESGNIMNGTNYIEVPNLYDGTLTPVVYSGNNWIVADATKNWYNYSKQEWANAVLLPSNIKKNVGDSVKLDGSEALAIYVWIPRYEYKIEGKYGKGGTSLSSPGEIDINFISKEITTPSNGYKIHPAFKFGGENLDGIWVAKFELGHSSKTYVNLKCSTTTCSQGNNLRVLPNIRALAANIASSFFYGIKSMDMPGNTFGIDGQKTDSHMIKNSEWGAVAYLSQSKYGKYGNKDYTGANKEIYINNSSGYLTGNSGGSPTAAGASSGTYKYDIEKNGTGASTTGNITGIYDMNGGSWEYTMSFFSDSQGNIYTARNTTSSYSGFTGLAGTDNSKYIGADLPNTKYFDLYKADSGVTMVLKKACNGGMCYGHALNETSGWYGDNSGNLSSSLTMFTRGGLYSDGAISGIFTYGRATGSNSATTATRPVLVSASKPTVITKNYSNGEIVYFDVSTGKKCTNYNLENSKTGYNGIDNKLGNQNSCLKFYAFNDIGSDTVNLLLDHNTTAVSSRNSVGDNKYGPKEVLEQLKLDTKNWKGTIAPSNYTTGITGRRYTVDYNGHNSRLISSNEVATIIGNLGYDENKIWTSYFFDTGGVVESSTCKVGNTTGCKYGWIYDRTSTDCATEGCLNNAEVDISGYWTMSAVSEVSEVEDHLNMCNGHIVFGISHHGRMGKACPNNAEHYGVRPVIEVLKSKL